MSFSGNTAKDGFAITASGSDLAQKTDALYCGDGGTVSVVTVRGTALTFTGVIAGSILPISVTKVTAGTGIIGLIEN